MTSTIEIQPGDKIVVKRKSGVEITQILQGLLGAVLLGVGICILFPHLEKPDFTLIAVLGLGIFLVGLDIICRAIRP